MAMHVPIISGMLTLFLKIKIDGAIIRTGVKELNVETMPASAFGRANNKQPTPTKGPKIPPRAINPMDFPFRNAWFISGVLRVKIAKTMKPIKALRMRTCVADMESIPWAPALVNSVATAIAIADKIPKVTLLRKFPGDRPETAAGFRPTITVNAIPKVVATIPAIA